MKIPIQRIKSNGKLKIHEQIKTADIGKDSKLIGPIEITGTLEYVGNEEIYFTGSLSAKVELTCVKCLKKFEQIFNIDFSESYTPRYFTNSKLPKGERDISELDVFTYDGNFIDLDKTARDILFEHIPPYPLCPECRAKE
jgi:uncharacterized metal-binding protein YceD (DUF177 family)